jgi:hypothetical protein
MKKLLNRLDDTDRRAFSRIKWTLSAVSASATSAFVVLLEAS